MSAACRTRTLDESGARVCRFQVTNVPTIIVSDGTAKVVQRIEAGETESSDRIVEGSDHRIGRVGAGERSGGRNTKRQWNAKPHWSGKRHRNAEALSTTHTPYPRECQEHASCSALPHDSPFEFNWLGPCQNT